MKRALVLMVILIVLCALWLAHSAWAMSSANYRLDWFTPLTGGGGGAANSTHYAVGLTVGQTASGASTSAAYKVGLGYWYGVDGSHRVYLPVILK